MSDQRSGLWEPRPRAVKGLMTRPERELAAILQTAKVRSVRFCRSEALCRRLHKASYADLAVMPAGLQTH
jgi:hypothetical protein